MQTTSLTLLARLKTGSDQQAWNRFVAIYTPLLYHCCRRMGLCEADALDLVQDVLISLLQQLGEFQYDADRRNFRGWLKTITINKCRDRFRQFAARAAKEQAAGEERDWQAPADDFWAREYRNCLVQEALKVMKTEFEDRTWQACWETAVNERSAKDVGQQLGMSESAVYVAKSRVLRRLREELAGLWD